MNIVETFEEFLTPLCNVKIALSKILEEIKISYCRQNAEVIMRHEMIGLMKVVTYG